MFYEEKVINGVLHIRTMPSDEFRPCSAQQLTEMPERARKELDQMAGDLALARAENAYS